MTAAITMFILVAMLSLGRQSTAEPHYKFRGPLRPPTPPLPPPLSIHRPVKHATFYKSKMAGPRVVGPPLRGPPAFLFERHVPHQHGPLVLGRPHAHKLPAFSYSEPLRSPVQHEHFASPQLASFELHTTARPVPPQLHYHQLAVDDDKGPIHTIPAPNLSLQDRPRDNYPSIAEQDAHLQQVHHSLSPSHQQLLGVPQVSSGTFGASAVADQGLVGHSANFQEAHNLGSAHLLSSSQQSLLGVPQVSPGTFGASAVSIQPSISYQVREETNDHSGQSPDGQHVYFAPDPDPQLPAPKTPTTGDPHSVPSNGRSPAELLLHHAQSQGSPLQLFETNTNVMHDGQSLSSQDLYRLLQGALPHQQQLLDTYPLPLLQQPQLQQHILQQQLAAAAGYPTLLPHAEVADNSLGARPAAEDFHPQLHTFNYEERASASEPAHFSSRPHFSSQLLDDETAESASQPKVTRTTAETTGGTELGPEASNEVEGDHEQGSPDSESTAFYTKVAKGAQLYTTLPSREAAETLATLAAAGNVNSDFMSRLRVEEEPAEDEGEEYSEEEEEDQEEEQVSTVAPTRRPPQLAGLYQLQDEYQVAGRPQFGDRIRPKRGAVVGD